MRLRILLPPNIEAAAVRNAIPTKLEVEKNEGQPIAPEKLSMEALGELNDAGRAAAFSLLQWCGGKLGSFLQLDKSQLAQLISTLQSEPSFYWINKPKEPIDWNFRELIGVSEFVNETPSEETKPEPTLQSSSQQITDTRAGTTADHFEGAPMIIDGSSHYLAIKLPSREHPCYAEIRELLESYRFKLEPSNRKWWLRDRHQTLNFLGEHWEDLEDRYYADFADGFLDRVKNITEARIRTEIVEEKNAYNLTVSIQAGDVSDREISQSLASGKNYIQSGERVFLLKKSKLEKLRALQSSLTEAPDAPLLHRGNYRISYSRTPKVEEEIAEVNPNFKPPATWRNRSAALRDLSKLPPPTLSQSLETTLRPYQKLGVSWLLHLYRNDLGGILADEMGLGKTLQALAFISSLAQEEKPQPTLIICPASLVENWRREAARFCPELKTQINHGQTRIQSSETLNTFDLIITSYGTLIRDKKLFSACDFRCVIADEAQHIKNRRTQNAKAITSLVTKGRFLLTGTPIENSIQDLMSLLDFIMPGGWKPIPNGARGDERKWHEQRILDQAAPYILRRTKAKVAPELPEKIEQVVFLEMSAAQKKIYEKTRQFAEQEIAQLEKSGASEGAVRMKTLTQLLRLRQACCDPRLLDETQSPEASAKLASFMELLEEAIDGEHRILVFSQFVSLLSILRETLDENEIPYCYIDGSTKNRMAQVDRFNDDDSIPVFLISLKAGGTGLNLTSADTVVHFDPWWNPAAEAQATDRAHRIGQSKIVTSYKLIVSDSVEEKVLQLQQSKRKLLEDVFEASEAANAKISLSEMRDLI